jgi:hypothetical protein
MLERKAAEMNRSSLSRFGAGLHYSKWQRSADLRTGVRRIPVFKRFFARRTRRRARVKFQELVLRVEAPPTREQAYNLERFVENLYRSRIFKAVEYRDRLPTADLVLSSFDYPETSPAQLVCWGSRDSY